MGGKDKGGLPHSKGKQKAFCEPNNYLAFKLIISRIVKKCFPLSNMKKSSLLFVLLMVLQLANAQSDSTKAPYLRFPSFPPVKLLLPDSVSYFSKNDLPKKSPVMLMLFNPQCEHCQHETEAITKNEERITKWLGALGYSLF